MARMIPRASMRAWKPCSGATGKSTRCLWRQQAVPAPVKPCWTQARAGQVKVFGFDLVPENAAMMHRGVIQALICQQPRRQGHDALRAAWQLLLNEGAAQEKILMETSICILQNMDEA